MSLESLAEFNRRWAREIRISKMTYRELQVELQRYQHITVRLNAKREVLEAELRRLYQEEYDDYTQVP